MNKIILLILFGVVVISCHNPNKFKEKESNDEEITISNNQELQIMHDQDQADRLPKSGEIDWETVLIRDSFRLKRAYELIDSNKVHTSKDNYNVAMIFQHGYDTIASGMAVRTMKKAVELDQTINKWLLAAAIDRDLQRRGKPQIFGIQLTKNNQDMWVLYDVDTIQLTDSIRKEFNVQTLAQLRANAKKMNTKKLFELVGEGKSIDGIINFIYIENNRDSKYDLSEIGINNFGYNVLNQGKKEEALKIFKLNTELYPQGYNTYDSYGECLLLLGQKEKAIKAYKKSLKLNPENMNAENIIKKNK